MTADPSAAAPSWRPPGRLARLYGLVRSVAIYHGIPWRAAQLRRFYARVVPRGGLAFDVGAHAGNRVRAFRALGARVVAIEPQADFVALLARLFSRDRDVTVHAGALGRTVGDAVLHASARNPTVSTLSADFVAQAGASAGFASVRWQPGPRVPVTTLDALIAAHGMPDFVKIDVEGYEHEVLLGLSQAPRAVSFEYLAPMRDVAIACVARLETLARYRYNWSVGERLRLVHPSGLDADAMRAWLAALPDDAPSGDVLAQRI